MSSAAFELSGSVVTTCLPTVHIWNQMEFVRLILMNFNLTGKVIFRSQARVKLVNLWRSLSTGEGSKRPYSATNPVNGGTMNASNKPEIASSAMGNRRIHRYKSSHFSRIFEGSLSALETCVAAEEEGLPDLDMSLHL